VVIGGLGVAVLAAIGAVAWKAPALFGGPRAYGIYVGITGQLNDQDQSVLIGKAVIAALPGFNASSVAQALRARIGTATLEDVAKTDAEKNRLLEAQGWVMPESVALACALAAATA
jgi:hypothetical protein